MEVRTTTSPYRADIDGLRALAILGVLLFHCFPGRVPGGFVGVDVFFVISGYLITGIIQRGTERGEFSFAAFYASRVRRIFPALLLVLATCLGVGWFLLLPSELSQLGKHTAGGIGFVENLVLWSEAGYFDGASAQKLLLHLWSLGVEEQFYLVFPLLLWLLRPDRSRTRSALIVLTMLSFGLCVWQSSRDRSAAYFLPQFRFWEILVGALCAQFSISKFTSRARNLAAAVGLAAVLAANLFLNESVAFPGAWALLPVLGSAFLIQAGSDAWVNRVLLSHRLPVGLGLISYPLYLWHWPVLTLVRIIEPAEAARMTRAALALLSVALAWLTYRFLERPIRKSRKSPAVVIALSCLAAALVVAAIVAHVQRGFPSRFQGRVHDLLTYRFDMPTSYRAGVCYRLSTESKRFSPESYAAECGRIVPGKESIFLWGDSFSAQLYPGLREVNPEKVVLQFSSPLCPPILGMQIESSLDCDLNNRFVLEQLRRSSPATVILAANWARYQWRDIEKTIVELQGLGVPRLMLVGPVPNWGRYLPAVLARQALRQADGVLPTHLPNGRLPASLQLDRELETLARRKGVDYFSPLRLLCGSGACLVRDEAGERPFTPLAFDEVHLTDVGSVLVAKGIRESPTAAGDRF